MKYLSKSLVSAIFILVLTASAFSQTEAVPDRNGILYEISGNGLAKPSYIFGTMHMICKNDMLDLEQLWSDIGPVEQAVMEIDFDDASQFSGLLTSGAKVQPTQLDKIYSKEELSRLDAVTRKYLTYPIEALNLVNPGMIQLMILSSPKILGCDAIGSYDLSLAGGFQSGNTPIHGLETVAEQLEVVSKTVTGKNAGSDLLEFVSNIGKFSTDLRNLITLHKNQDLNALYAETRSQMEGKAEFEDELLTKRNLKWLPKLEGFIHEKPTFIAVGAAHLGGKNGVLTLLEEKGYTVRSIRLETKPSPVPESGENGSKAKVNN